jgi:nucleotide-binding universal stress UspA family protein
MAPPQKVLIAYDGSQGARHALEDLSRNRAGLPVTSDVLVLCAADIWRTVTISSIGPFPLSDMPLTSAQVQQLQAAERASLRHAYRTATEGCRRLRDACPHWQVRAESCAGSPEVGIPTRAAEWRADMIVMGSHGRSPMGRLLLGSVSAAVVKDAPCSVRVVRGPVHQAGAPSCIVIGFDASAHAEAAVQAAADRIWPAGTTARLVTVIDGRMPDTLPAFRWLEALDRYGAAWMHRMIQDPVERLRAAGLSVSPVIQRGNPSAVLLDEARYWDADMIFVGARGLRGLKRLFLGSVSTAIAMQAPCTVEVRRPQHEPVVPPHPAAASTEVHHVA